MFSCSLTSFTMAPYHWKCLLYDAQKSLHPREDPWLAIDRYQASQHQECDAVLPGTSGNLLSGARTPPILYRGSAWIGSIWMLIYFDFLMLDFTFGELPVLRSISSVDRNPGSTLLGVTVVLVLVHGGNITADCSKMFQVSMLNMENPTILILTHAQRL